MAVDRDYVVRTVEAAMERCCTRGGSAQQVADAVTVLTHCIQSVDGKTWGEARGEALEVASAEMFDQDVPQSIDPEELERAERTLWSQITGLVPDVEPTQGELDRLHAVVGALGEDLEVSP